MWSYALEQWVHAVPTALTLFKPLGMFSFSEQVSFSKEFWGLYGDKECGPEGLMRKYTHALFINFFKFKKKKKKKKWLPMIHVNKSNWPFEHDCKETQWWRKWNQHHCTVKIAISKWIPYGTISSYMKSDNICQTPTVLATHTLHTTNPLFLSPKHFSSHLTPQTQRRRIQCEQAH